MPGDDEKKTATKDKRVAVDRSRAVAGSRVLIGEKDLIVNDDLTVTLVDGVTEADVRAAFEGSKK